MGQPINVVEKPTSTPGVARFETNRSLTGMGHERYASVDDVLDDRPVDVLARRLFETGGVTKIHANGSVVTVHLAEGWTGGRLLDVIRGLYTYYPPTGNGDAAPAAPEPEPDAAASEPEAAAEPEPDAAASEPEAAAEPEAATPGAEPHAEPETVAEPEPEGAEAATATPEAAENAGAEGAAKVAEDE